VCCKSWNRRACLLPLWALLCACSGDQHATRKLAVLPFENLSASRELDWVGRALAEVVTAQLTGSPEIEPAVAPGLREAAGSGATGIVHGYYSMAAGRLRVEAVVENTATRRAAKTASAAGAPGGILALADAVARQLDPQARRFSTASEAALRAYVEALGAREPAGDFERAVSADPNFGAAYLAWAQWLVARGERARARQAVAAGLGRGAGIPEVERARLGVLAAALDGDRVAERRALAGLARATPADASVYERLAAMDLASRAYPAAVRWYEKALEREPDNVALLNETGYAQAYARDLEAATKSLSRYRDLRPLEANPLDSLGDVHFYLGQFSRAEKYYLEAYARDASFLSRAELYKVAWARLMGGDLKGADEAFAKYLEARRGLNDLLVPYRRAQWEYLTGRRKQAIARLDQVVQAPQTALASLAAAQLSIWRLETGNAAQARQDALRAGPGHPLSGACRLWTEPPASASEWAVRAERAFPEASQAGLRQYALGYALLFSKHFPEAAVCWTKLYQQTPPGSPDPVEVQLAWALVETGRFAPAEELLAANPIPDALREHPFLSLSFPRVFFLRGVLLERQGRRQEARANYEMFLRLSGDLPAIFGEERRAREALGRL